MIERENYSRTAQELIVRARQTNLADYLISRGEPLVKSGAGRYKHAEHDSLVFTDNAYYWNSRDEHGNAIDFLRSFYNMDFKEAVKALTGELPSAENSTASVQRKIVSERYFNFDSIILSPDMRRIIEYLCGRGISKTLILDLISRRLLFQEKVTNNIIFPIYDGNAIVGAEVAGTLSNKRFKGIKSGSKYSYGYNLSFGEQTKFLLFFESPIDLISFVDIEKTRGKSLANCRLVSLAGLKSNVIERELQAANGAARAFLCVDNDAAGARFIRDVTELHAGVKVFLPDKMYKDWNEQLQAER
jgi:hypothetical protein